MCSRDSPVTRVAEILLDPLREIGDAAQRRLEVVRRDVRELIELAVRSARGDVACSIDVCSWTSSNCSSAAICARARRSSAASPRSARRSSTRRRGAHEKTLTPANGSSATFTFSASVLNSSATSRGTRVLVKRIVANSSPGGSSPPNPSTDRTPYGMTNCCCAGMCGLPTRIGNVKDVEGVLRAVEHARPDDRGASSAPTSTPSWRMSWLIIGDRAMLSSLGSGSA